MVRGVRVRYDPAVVQPMREDLTRLGFDELFTPEDVDRALAQGRDSTLVVVNSICGCAAGMARPAVRLALLHPVVPTRLLTVFAGMEVDATQRLRSYLVGYPPSSPSMALFVEGRLVHMVQRRDIEGRMPDEIAAELAAAFDRFCVRSA
jgi:putative YphP/YqiW family bacilliredoxin